MHAAKRVVPRLDLKWLGHGEMVSHASRSSENAAPFQVELIIPCEGAASAIIPIPHFPATGGTIRHRLPPGSESSHPLWAASISLTLDSQGKEAMGRFEESLRLMWSNWEDVIRARIEVVNEQIDEHRMQVREAVTSIIRPRQVRVMALWAASRNLSIPLRPTGAKTLAVPLSARRISLRRIEQSRESGAPEFALADNIADDLVDTINAFGHALERLPKTANRLIGEDEEGIRDHLLFVLNANYRGAVTGETFVGRAKLIFYLGGVIEMPSLQNVRYGAVRLGLRRP